MTFSILTTMRRLTRPDHELSCSPLVVEALIAELRARGRGVNESGAFLLGHRNANGSRIESFILYDDLDPHCLNTGIVRIDGRCFGELWERCRTSGLTVVADVHTHPVEAVARKLTPTGLAPADRAPLASSALIVPQFAKPQFAFAKSGIYRYLGDKRWETVDSRRFHIGL